MSWAIDLAEKRLLPDAVVRAGIRRLLARRLRAELAGDDARQTARLEAFVDELRSGPIAVATDAANEQHYALPPAFFETVLGPRLKYSSCIWPDGVDDLAAAEELMLGLTCERAGLEDGMELLDLGCGWGSLALWVARRYPRCRVLAVSNSRPQGRFIRDRAAAAGVGNLEVVTADMRSFDTDRRFDRVISVEMFEHMRNWRLLFGRVAGWLKPDGALLMHYFCHSRLAYPYVDADSGDWMARHFFTGGIMPSEDLPRRFPEHLEVDRQWRISGLDYSRTLEAWLQRMDAERERLLPVFRQVCGHQAERNFARWRIFFMACSELFRYRGGGEWFVSHTLMRPKAQTAQGSATTEAA